MNKSIYFKGDIRDADVIFFCVDSLLKKYDAAEGIEHGYDEFEETFYVRGENPDSNVYMSADNAYEILKHINLHGINKIEEEISDD